MTNLNVASIELLNEWRKDKASYVHERVYSAGKVRRRVRAGPRGVFSRLDCLEFNAPLVQASPGHPQLLRQLLDIIISS